MCHSDIPKHVSYKKKLMQKIQIFYLQAQQKFSDTLRPMKVGNFESAFLYIYIALNVLKLTYVFQMCKSVFRIQDDTKDF